MNKYPNYPLLILIVVSFFLGLFFSMKNAPLRGEEPRRGVVSFEALTNDNYVCNTTYGEPYYNKPPVFHYLVAKSFKIFDVSNFSLRIPGAIGICLIFFLVFVLYWRQWYLALLVGFLSISYFDFSFYQSIYLGEIDIIFSALILGLFINLYFSINRAWPFIYIAVGLGVLAFLTKGVPALPFLVFGLISCWIVDNYKWKYVLHGILSLAIFFGSLVLFYKLYQSYQGLADVFFCNLMSETLNKSMEDGQNGFLALCQSIAGNLLLFFKLGLPWILLIPVLYRANSDPSNYSKLIRFTLVFIGFNSLPYLFSDVVKGRYLIAFYPMFAIVIVELLKGKKGKLSAKVVYNFKLAVSILLVILVTAFLILHLSYSIPIISSILVLGLLLFSLVLFWPKQLFLPITYFKQCLLSSILPILLAKLVFSVTVLNEPIQSNEIPKQQLSEVLKRTHLPLSYLANYDYTNSNLDLFGREVCNLVVQQMASPSFHFAFYYIQETGNYLKYTNRIEMNRAYLMRHDKYMEQFDKLTQYPIEYIFRDQWTGQIYLLIQTNSNTD